MLNFNFTGSWHGSRQVRGQTARLRCSRGGCNIDSLNDPRPKGSGHRRLSTYQKITAFMKAISYYFFITGNKDARCYLCGAGIRRGKKYSLGLKQPDPSSVPIGNGKRVIRYPASRGWTIIRP